jgi:DNA sulfur modification protein DndD
MKLLSLELSNFRVFYGLHNIDFSHSDDKPLTIMTGFNGGGKTSLLNALYWCFTGTTTPQLKDPDLLVNKDAANDEKNAIAYSEVTFQEKNDIYRIRRTVNASNTKQSFSIFFMPNMKLTHRPFRLCRARISKKRN